MKKIILIALGLILLVIAGIAYFLISNASTLVQKFKPEIEKMATEATGSPVKLGELGVSIFPSTAITVSSFSIGTDAEALRLKDIILNINLKALLNSELKITKLVLNKPDLVVIKDASGVKVPGIPKDGVPKGDAQKEPPAQKHETEPKAASAEGEQSGKPLTISLESFELNDGSLVFKDTVAGAEYSLKQFNIASGLEIAGDTITLPKLTISGTGHLGAAAPQVPFSVVGEKLSVDGANGIVSVPNLALNVLGNLIDLQAKMSAKSGNADGVINIKKVAHSVNGFNVTDMAGVINFSMSGSNINAKSDKLSLGLNGQPIELSFASLFNQAAQTLDLKPFKVQAFSGTTEGDFNLNLAQSAKPFSTNVKIYKLDAAKALSVLPGGNAAKLSGTLESLSTQMRGELGTDPKATINGTVDMNFKEGRMEGINIAGQVIKAVTSLPFLKSGLYSAVPDGSRGAVDADYTSIRSLTGRFDIGGAALRTQSLNVVSDLFSLDGKGRVGFDSSMDVTSTISFNQQFSEGMAGKVKELKTLFDKSNRLTIPLAISGTPPKLLVVPNMEKLLEVAGTNLLQQGATKLLEKQLQKKGLGNLFGF